MFDINITYFVFIGLFLLFMIALKAMVLEPLGQVLDQRQKLIQDNLDTSEKLKKEVLELEQSYELKIHEAKLKAKTIVTTAIEECEKGNNELIAKAVMESNSTIDNTKNILLQDKDKLLQSLVPEVSIIAKKIIKVISSDLLVDKLEIKHDILKLLQKGAGS